MRVIIRLPRAVNDTASLADRIDAVLPQTQCERCGYHGCRPYAEAIAAGAAAINRCPPGGADSVRALAALLGCEPLALDPACGDAHPRLLARIVEAECIGCTKCIQVCPVDAIVGAPKLMHSVIADQCSGCELCVPACPVDCIVLEPMPAAQLDRLHADAARGHFRAREARLARDRTEREAQLAARKAALHRPVAASSIDRGAVLAAIARAKAKRAARGQMP
jgi:electron transport complex protein RnfB